MFKQNENKVEKEKNTIKERRKKRKKKKEKNLVKQFLHMVFIVMTTILILMTASIVYIELNPTTVVAGIESTLLATGIAIIGVAIAVWAGLNIIQVLEKDKFELLSKEVTQYSEERKILNRINFLSRVALEKNELSRYVYDKLTSKIDEDNDDIPSELYFELNKVEMDFQSAYKEQYEQQRTLTKEFYDDAIQNCKDLMKQAKTVLNEDNFIREYLKICILEFNFYKGYVVDGEEMRRCFQNVVDGFCEIFSELRKPKELAERGINENVYLTVYMLNTIGEAYSKIIDSYRNTVIKDKEGLRKQVIIATEYFESLHLIIEKNAALQDKDNKKRLLREVYYRNYGIFLERNSSIVEKNTSGFKYKSKIRECYQTSMDLVMCDYDEKVRYQTFYAWLSFYIKVMDKNNNNIKDLLTGGKCKYDNHADLKNYTKSAAYYVETALREYPTKTYFLRCQAFVERDFAIWNIYEKDFKEAYGHVENLGKLVAEINVVENLRKQYESKKFPDNYLKELTDDYQTLKKFW